MPQRRHLNTADMNRPIGMLEPGRSQRQVANVFGVSQSVISRMLNRYQTFGRVDRRHGGGRQRVTTGRQDRFLIIQARRYRFQNATTLRNDLQNATGVRISTQTVRSRLHGHGLRARRPAIRVPLTVRHIRDRLDFGQFHLNWRLVDWEPVLFTDESRYCLDFTDRRARVWRLPSERFHQDNVAEHDRYGGGSIMVWGGISLRGKTDLHIIENGTLTGLRYRDEILDVYVRPYAGAIGPDFILMDDNARAHRARIVNDYL